MTDLPDFLSALYPETAGDLRMEFEEGVVDIVSNLGAYQDAAAGADIYVYPVTDAGLACFVAQFTEQASPNEWASYNVKPTAVLTKDASQIAIWAFDPPVDDVALVTKLAESVGSTWDEPIPSPGAGGWEVAHLDPDTFHPIATLVEFFSDEEPEPVVSKAPTAEGSDVEYGVLNQARVVLPFDLTAPDLQEQMTISVGANFKSVKWRNDTMTRAFFYELLSKHPEGRQKDGPGFVLAEIVGDNRRKQAVKACYGIGLDIDTGLPGTVIDAELKALGCGAVRYTTFSHSKTTSKLNKDRITKWCGKNDLEFNADSVLEFLRRESKWDHRLLETAEYVGDVHDPEGLMACVNHAPMEKHRIVMPLAEPFIPTTVAPTHAEGMKLWADVCKALARRLGDLPMDNSAVDPSRLFYFPRHAKGRPHETVIFGGPAFDWRTLDLGGQAASPAADPNDPFAQVAAEASRVESEKGETKGKSQTEAGKKLGRWSIKGAHGFQIVDVIKDHADDRVRTPGSTKIDIECPFDEEHSNPGDPEDRGCFAVNAGDGPSEIFTIKCQHDSCQGKTNLDFLGKMIADEWFGDEVLKDPMYNASTPEESSQPELAVKLTRIDNAREDYETLMDALTLDSDDDQVEEALSAYVRAEITSPRTRQRIEEGVQKRLKMTKSNLSRLISEVKRTVVEQDNKSGAIVDPKGRSVFSFSGDFHADEAWDACFRVLKQANAKDGEPTFSCVQDKPVRLARDKKTGRLSFDELKPVDLWSELNNRITFVRKNDQGDGSRQAVPEEVSKHVFAQAYNELPQSPEIIYTPLFTKDGDLVLTPGYIPELNIIMADTGFKVDVPVDPTPEDVEEAVRFLTKDLLVDFPFKDFDLEGEERREPSEANCLAMILTPFMRRMINGCTPVFFVAKPVPGTGGTLLGKVPMLIFDGAESAPMRYTQNDEEMSKALLSAVIETRSHLFFDDVKDFNSRSLIQSITAENIGGRVLGSTKNITRPNLFNWVGTGNNPFVGAEMERRICWIRLNLAGQEVQGRVYVHNDLPGWITENRPKIVRAILTMIQYWLDTGREPFTLRSRASFEDWSRKVGGVLQACGVEGFLNNRKVAAMDMEEQAIQMFVREWLKNYGHEKLTPAKMFGWAVDMQLEVIEGQNDEQKRSKFQRRLYTLIGRTFNVEGVTYMVRSDLDSEQNGVYYLAPVTNEEAEPAPVDPATIAA